MERKRIIVPSHKIKRRCICRQCGRDVYSSDLARDNLENDAPAADRDDPHREHVYPHPDTWEP